MSWAMPASIVALLLLFERRSSNGVEWRPAPHLRSPRWGRGLLADEATRAEGLSELLQRPLQPPATEKGAGPTYRLISERGGHKGRVANPAGPDSGVEQPAPAGGSFDADARAVPWVGNDLGHAASGDRGTRLQLRRCGWSVLSELRSRKPVVGQKLVRMPTQLQTTELGDQRRKGVPRQLERRKVVGPLGPICANLGLGRSGPAGLGAPKKTESAAPRKNTPNRAHRPTGERRTHDFSGLRGAVR